MGWKREDEKRLTIETDRVGDGCRDGEGGEEEGEGEREMHGWWKCAFGVGEMVEDARCLLVRKLKRENEVQNVTVRSASDGSEKRRSKLKDPKRIGCDRDRGMKRSEVKKYTE